MSIRVPRFWEVQEAKLGFGGATPEKDPLLLYPSGRIVICTKLGFGGATPERIPLLLYLSGRIAIEKRNRGGII